MGCTLIVCLVKRQKRKMGTGTIALHQVSSRVDESHLPSQTTSTDTVFPKNLVGIKFCGFIGPERIYFGNIYQQILIWQYGTVYHRTYTHSKILNMAMFEQTAKPPNLIP